jgi:hypothetical protein
MRLHGIVAPIVGSINPNITVKIHPSIGYIENSSGVRKPNYGEPFPLLGQVQSLTYTDIITLNGLNITGIRRAVYLSGDIEGIVRVNQQGGDLIELPDGSVWLVAYVLENYALTSGWVKVAVTMQNQ